MTHRDQRFTLALVASGALLLIGLSVLLHAVADKVVINSDIANSMLQAQSMANGNVFLHGWTTSSVPYWITELPLYAVLLRFGATTQTAVFIGSALCIRR